MNKFDQLFARKHDLIFLPFFVLGFPNSEHCLSAIDAAIESGADALELGIPFSDPIADGPIIQEACEQVLKQNFNLQEAFSLIQTIRHKHPSIPIGILVYAQSIEHAGIQSFFKQAKSSGVDSVLIADVPVYESYPYEIQAKEQDIHLIHLATPSSDAHALQRIAQGSGYTYVVTRKGVTGIDQGIHIESLNQQIETLQHLNAPPAILGFGIHQRDDILKIRQSKAKGFIIGSKLTSILHKMRPEDFQDCTIIRQTISQWLA